MTDGQPVTRIVICYNAVMDEIKYLKADVKKTLLTTSITTLALIAAYIWFVMY